jgi:Raf kinase inhibitor-like YbhB/YbcL family protein
MRWFARENSSWKSSTTASVLLGLLVSCASRAPAPIQQPTPAASQENKMEIKVTSTAFQQNQAIPRGYTCDGSNVSPPLEWTGVPKSAKTLAIIADDPDAPAGTWVHWVLYNLPADKIGIVENTPTTETLSGGGRQGMNDFKKTGYGGPCPPSGSHRYFFKLYALDTELPLKPGATKADLEKAMQGHVVAQGELMGTYRRQK